MSKSQASILITIFFLILLFLYGLAFYLNGTLDSSASLQVFEEWIPYDSIQYVEKSEILSFSDLNLFDVVTGALNWLSLSFIYKVLNDIGGLGGLGFVFINCLCFYLMVRLGSISASTGSRSSLTNRHYYPVFLFFSSPFLFAWILVPNKELLVAIGMLGIIHAIATRRTLLFIALTLALGLIKIQFIIATALYLSTRKLRWRKTVTLVGISLIYPLLYQEVLGLQMSHFLDVNPNEIRSAEIFLAIDNLSSYPFGYILIFLSRLAFNIFGGINPIRIIESDFSMSGLAPLTSFILGFLALLTTCCIIKRHDIRRILNSNSDKLFYVFCFLVVNASLPFMQPRYYWWAIPILLSYLMFGNQKRNNEKYSTAEISANDVKGVRS